MDLSRTKLVRMLRAQLQASPKQAKLLALLAAVFLIALVRVIFTLGPAETEAASPVVNADVLATATPTQPEDSQAPTAREPLPELPSQAERNLFTAGWLTSLPEKPRKTVDSEPADEVTDDDTTPVFVLELTLTGATDATQHYAVINGERLRVGDAISGYVLQSIAPGVVLLLDDEGDPMIVLMN